MAQTRADLEAEDANDLLGAWRDRFALPDGVIYLDGNSLGALPKAVSPALSRTVTEAWGRDLITSWNRHGWVDLPARVGAKIARLIGAAAHEVTVTDSISVNLFKLISAALTLRPDRSVVLAEVGSFPTDLYIVQGLRALLGGRPELRLVDADDLERALEPEVALLLLSHVDYRSGGIHDMARLTAAAHEVGALALWDLAHSAGAMPVDLAGAGADFAVGCGYKYLNGGPGAPAFLFVAERWLEQARQPLTGWFGHRQPFAFDGTYRPADGVARFLCGTPPILSLIALDAALEVFAEVDLDAVRAKSIRLTELLVRLIEQRCRRFGVELASPRNPERRGSQVVFRHPEAYAIVQALIADGVIGDFRAPDLMRFGIAPLYLRSVDIDDAARALERVLETRAYERPEFRDWAAVT